LTLAKNAAFLAYPGLIPLIQLAAFSYEGSSAVRLSLAI
jgi:hypothetical protein